MAKTLGKIKLMHIIVNFLGIDLERASCLFLSRMVFQLLIVLKWIYKIKGMRITIGSIIKTSETDMIIYTVKMFYALNTLSMLKVYNAFILGH